MDAQAKKEAAAVADETGKIVDFDALNTADGMFVVDGEQRIVHWNDSAEQILGYPAEAVLGKRCFDVIGGRDSSSRRYCRRNCPVISNAKRGRASRDYDLSCATAHGESKWLNIGIMVPGKGPMRGYAIHLLRDVTMRRGIEEFARRAAKALRELRSGPEDDAMAEEQRPAPAPALSKREDQVLRLLATGMKTREIAEALGVQPVTARNHVTRLLNKLGAESRLEAVLYASHRGII